MELKKEFGNFPQINCSVGSAGEELKVGYAVANPPYWRGLMGGAIAYCT
ncbi:MULTISPECIES: hypothetical protein [Cyanophyceae]|nr:MULTISPECIES: hypothetical protein [Cyanophyceae]MDB9330503.1 hypothetical protein [Nodularia spumigena CS-591/04]MDB9304289.1 hypothetical protein [Nodularia spumigena CS-591/12]MDB9318084.1 hypothetical protein [Nodularia spumigena CS-590/01A]MDB9320352.1 hypothetical protein [Nodularia spumigena CS-591/07A]MDB9326801.1 hypothetical protein [Nodularia spumigena CS-590/02]